MEKKITTPLLRQTSEHSTTGWREKQGRERNFKGRKKGKFHEILPRMIKFREFYVTRLTSYRASDRKFFRGIFYHGEQITNFVSNVIVG